MSKVVKGIGKVFKKVGKAVAKVLPIALGIGAIVFTAGAALAPAGTLLAGGWGGAVSSTLGSLGLSTSSTLGSVLTGAVTQAGYGAAIGMAGGALTGQGVAKGAQYGAAAGAVTGGISGALNASTAAATAPAKTAAGLGEVPAVGGDIGTQAGQIGGAGNISGTGGVDALAGSQGADTLGTAARQFNPMRRPTGLGGALSPGSAPIPGATPVPGTVAPPAATPSFGSKLGNFLSSPGGMTLVGNAVSGLGQGWAQKSASDAEIDAAENRRLTIERSYNLPDDVSFRDPGPQASGAGSTPTNMRPRYRYNPRTNEIELN